jgi:hypothetical protein
MVARVMHVRSARMSTRCRPRCNLGMAGRRMPTSLDNGRRSPRKLLRAVVARLFGRKS